MTPTVALDHPGGWWRNLWRTMDRRLRRQGATTAVAVPGQMQTQLQVQMQPPMPMALAAAQDVLQWLPRGAVLHVHRGAVLLEEAPGAWGGRAWRRPLALPRGRAWVASRSGWVRLTAGPARCELSARLPAGRHCPPQPPC